MGGLLTLEELIDTVLQKMSEMDYAKQTILNYQRFYRRFLNFANERNEVYFTENLGSSFLLENYGCTHDTIHENSPTKKICVQVRYIRVLGDYQIHGIILRRKLGPTAASVCPKQFQTAFNGYLEECQSRNLSEQGNYSRMNRIRHFIFYLNEHGIDDCNRIDATILAEYIRTFINYSSKSMTSTMVAIRCFLQYLYLNELTSQNMADSLPKIKNYYAPAMPKTWKTEEVTKVLSCIDRGNPTGKRDYAILLMVARYGLRCSDIKNIKLENLQWHDSTIQIIQHKTGNPVSFPLLRDVGWALIDYLKTGRPRTKSEYVFVRHVAPFEAFTPNSALSRILVKYIREAGIPVTRETPLGMHSLRHTLASTLLEENIPLPVISEILGHSNLKSTEIYLHIDYARLRECALNPEEVFDR